MKIPENSRKILVFKKSVLLGGGGVRPADMRDQLTVTSIKG